MAHLAELIAKGTGLKVNVSENPVSGVALGLAKIYIFGSFAADDQAELLADRILDRFIKFLSANFDQTACWRILM